MPPLAPGNIIYLRLRVTAGAGHHQEGAGVQKRYANTLQREVFKLDFSASISTLSTNFQLQPQLYLEGQPGIMST